MVKMGVEGGRSTKSGLSIPEVRESELTPLERGLIGQVVRLIDAVETWKSSYSQEMAQLKSENVELLECLRGYEQRISDLQSDIERFEKRLSRL